MNSEDYYKAKEGRQYKAKQEQQQKAKQERQYWEKKRMFWETMILCLGAIIIIFIGSLSVYLILKYG